MAFPGWTVAGLPAAVDAALGAVLEQVIPGVVRVWNGRGGFGAGFLARPGLVVTSAHLLARGPHRVTLWTGAHLPAVPVIVEPELDLAVLRLPQPVGPALPLRDPATLRVGSLMLALGHPWGEPYSVTLGVFSGWVTVRTGGPRGTLRLLRTDAALAPGNSGGPLLDAWGRVVGVSAMVVGGDQSLAVPADAVDGLIREGNG
ncbi:S1C family serine protease [Thermoflexus sp.]|jgi:serine protease Do|uniref:S1C family serine protease n=1 Tax=Thermoflexus sp. TaxID=1969742 RepID=UPI003C053987